jgi:general stress protein 26
MMDRQAIIEAAKDLVRAGRSFVLATVDSEGVPQVRWMGAAYLEEPFVVYMAAGAESRKIGQMGSHPKSQLMFQTEDYSRVATLTGTCGVVEDVETKRRVFEGIPGAAQYFSGPEDATFAALKFECQRVEMLGMAEGMAPVSAEV